MSKSKKLVLGFAGVVLVAGMLFGFTNLMSMVRSGVNDLQDAAQESVPVDVQIEQLERKLEGLEPVIEDAKHEVVKQEIVVEDQQKKVDTLIASIDTQWSEIVALKDAYKNAAPGAQYVSVGDARHDRNKVKSDLSRRLTRHDAATTGLTAQQTMLERYQSTLAAREARLTSLQNSKNDLESKTEELKARYELLKSRQIESGDTVDDSEVEDIKALLNSVDRRIREKDKMQERESAEYGEIDVTPAAPERDILEEIDARETEKATDGKASDLINTVK